MKNSITRQEWDTLSAYLDNALKPKERQKLETLLQSRADLRTALNELRQTRQLLRLTPALRVPRNFTLTQEMAGVRAPQARTYPVFKLAFALASFLFIMVIGGEVIFGNPAAQPVGDVAMAPQTEMFAMEAAQEEAMEMAPAEEARVMDETPMEEEGGGMAESSPALDGTPTPEMSLFMAETPTPEEMTKKAPDTTEVVIEQAMPAEESVETSPMTESTSDQMPVDEPQPGFWNAFNTPSPWRLLQIIFGGAVLLSGLGLLILRRRN